MPGGGTLVADSAGNLYGTAVAINGNKQSYVIVFVLSPPSSGNGAWTETVIGISGNNGTAGPLVIDKSGNLYGTTYLYEGYGGTVFKLEPGPPWS